MTQQKQQVKYAHLHGEGPKWFSVTFKFDPLVIQAIKDTAGMGNYEWNPRKKKWYIHRAYLDAITDMLKGRAYTVYTHISDQKDAYRAGQDSQARKEAEGRRRREEARQKRQEQERRQTNENVWNDFFGQAGQEQRKAVSSGFTKVQSSWGIVFSDLDQEVAKKLFRQASLALHPDAGGSKEAFQALNSAWQEYNR